MAIPVLESDFEFAAEPSGASSITIDIPAGNTSGDLLLLLMMGEFNTVKFLDDLTGWDLEETNGAQGNHVALYSRISDGTEGSTVTVTPSSSATMLGWCVRVSGADSTTPINVTGVSAQSGGTTHTVDAVTTTADDCLAIYFMGYDGGDYGSFSQPTGWTEAAEGNTGTAAGDMGAVFGSKDIASAGTTGDADIDVLVPDGMVAIMFAVAPGAADAVAPTLSTSVVPAAGTTIVLTYDENLDEGSVPAIGDFSIATDATDRDAIAVDTGGVAVAGSAVTLTTDRTIDITETITVSYTAGVNPIQDSAGNDAANLSSQATTNNSTQIISPNNAGNEDTVTSADAETGTDSVWQYVSEIAASGDYGAFPSSYAGGTITAETANGNLTGRFSVSSGTGNGSFTVDYYDASAGSWDSIVVSTVDGSISTSDGGISKGISFGFSLGF